MTQIRIQSDGTVESLAARARNRQPSSRPARPDDVKVVRQDAPIPTTVRPRNEPKTRVIPEPEPRKPMRKSGIAEEAFRNLLDKERGRFARKSLAVPKAMPKELKDHALFNEAVGILREMGVDPYSDSGQGQLEQKLAELSSIQSDDSQGEQEVSTELSRMRANLKSRILELRELLKERAALKAVEQRESRDEHQNRRYESLTDRLKSTIKYVRRLRLDVDKARKRIERSRPKV